MHFAFSALRRVMDWRFIGLTAALLALLLWNPFGGGKVEAALSNAGFEAGNLSGWSVGLQAEGIVVVGADTINAEESVVQTPLEGQYMARLGKPQPSRSQGQPQGINELVQEFTIDGASLKFAYNIWTYDYTGYDQFAIELCLVSPGKLFPGDKCGEPEGTIIYSYSQQAWGPGGDTSRKNTGWIPIDIPTSQYQGKMARLKIAAGGTRDNLYAFWAYVDSAENVSIPKVVDLPGIRVNGSHPSSDPGSKTVEIRRNVGSSPFHIDVPVLCPDGSDPTSVTAILGSSPPTSVSLTKGAGNIWSGDIPIPASAVGGTKFALTLVVVCNGNTIPIFIGNVTLIDPSGFITDAVTKKPVVEATVTLQKLEGTNWVTVNPFALVSGSPTVDPQVNPQLTDETGHYGWDVIAGTYRVVVVKTGYVSQTSKQVTVPPPVLDLNLALQPGTGPAATPTGIPGGTPTATPTGGGPAATPGAGWNDSAVVGWNNLVWLGTSGTGVGAALAGLSVDGQGAVRAMWRFIAASQSWLRNLYFPDGTSSVQIAQVNSGQTFWLLVGP